MSVFPSGAAADHAATTVRSAAARDTLALVRAGTVRVTARASVVRSSISTSAESVVPAANRQNRYATSPAPRPECLAFLALLSTGPHMIGSATIGAWIALSAFWLLLGVAWAFDEFRLARCLAFVAL